MSPSPDRRWSPIRIVKRRWGHTIVRYAGWRKTPLQLHIVFALANLYQVKPQLLSM